MDYWHCLLHIQIIYVMAEFLLLIETESMRNVKEVKRALLFAEAGLSFHGLNGEFQHHKLSSSLCAEKKEKKKKTAGWF